MSSIHKLMCRVARWNSRSSSCSARGRGFTLIELLVVLSIILVIAGIAVSSISGFGSPKQQLRREARGVLTLLAEARRTAMVRKLNVDVYVDEASRTVCAVESRAARQLLSSRSSSDRLIDLAETGLQSNCFFRTVVLAEDVSLEPLLAQEPDTTSVRHLSPSIAEGAAPSERLAVSFSHLGGATRGGLRVARGDVFLDIACDVLTGRAHALQRQEPSP